MDVISSTKVNKYMSGIIRGDRNSLDSLFAYTHNNMRIIATHYCSAGCDVDDVVSDLYCRIVKYAHTFCDDFSGYSWMVQIVKTIAFRYNKENQRCTDIEPYENTLCDDDSDDAILQGILVNNAVDQLLPADKALLVKIYWEGFTATEIANATNVPVGTVYSRIKIVQRKLKAILTNTEESQMGMINRGNVKA